MTETPRNLRVLGASLRFELRLRLLNLQQLLVADSLVLLSYCAGKRSARISIQADLGRALSIHRGTLNATLDELVIARLLTERTPADGEYVILPDAATWQVPRRRGWRLAVKAWVALVRAQGIEQLDNGLAVEQDLHDGLAEVSLLAALASVEPIAGESRQFRQEAGPQPLLSTPAGVGSREAIPAEPTRPDLSARIDAPPDAASRAPENATWWSEVERISSADGVGDPPTLEARIRASLGQYVGDSPTLGVVESPTPNPARVRAQHVHDHVKHDVHDMIHVPGGGEGHEEHGGARKPKSMPTRLEAEIWEELEELFGGRVEPRYWLTWKLRIEDFPRAVRSAIAETSRIKKEDGILKTIGTCLNYQFRQTQRLIAAAEGGNPKPTNNVCSTTNTITN